MGISARDSLVLLAILGSGAGLLALAPLLRVPYPILLVVGGLALGFVPGIPHVALRPDVVLVAILPPLLYFIRLLHVASRSATQCPSALTARDRTRIRHDACRCRDLSRSDRGSVVAGLLRARRTRRTDRRRRGQRDCVASGGSAPDRDADRGREPRQ